MPHAAPRPAPPHACCAAGGALCTAAEFERLLARLGSLPTTEAEDQALLDKETGRCSWGGL